MINNFYNDKFFLIILKKVNVKCYINSIYIQENETVTLFDNELSFTSTEKGTECSSTLTAISNEVKQQSINNH